MKQLNTLLKMARDKAERLYNTRNISFLSNKQTWTECLQIEHMEGQKWMILNFNVGDRSHTVIRVFENGQVVKEIL